tara:strand:- start:227 stop:568 length:342 start_codon:yes stop_codon:yes gene_type:complete
MVKIINHGLKPLIRRLGTGLNIRFEPGQEVDITDEALIAQIKGRKRIGNLQIKDSVGKKNVGGGLKTGSRRPKSRSKPSKPQKEVSLKSKIAKKVDRVLKKPKGLRRPKRKAK